MPKLNKKQIKIVALVLLLLLIATVSIGVTLAYIVDRTPDAENTFVPITVDSTPVATGKGKIAVMNNGDVTAYLRAAVTVTWVSVDEEGKADGNYHVNSPVEGVNYSIAYDETGAWQKGSDGFWYYKLPIDAGLTTSDLVVAFESIASAPAGYALSIEVVTTGIQSIPTSVVERAWNVTVDADGAMVPA